MRRFSESAQRTSEIAGEVSRVVVLDYDQVASRFYEDQIMRLRKELQKYREQFRSSAHATGIGTDLVFTTESGARVPAELRRKMSTFVEEAESCPEEL